MSKYHIKKNGEAGICRATKRPCPVGGEHFENKAAAEEAAHKKLQGKEVKTLKKTSSNVEAFKKALPQQVKKWYGSSTEVNFDKKNLEDIMQKAVKQKAAGKFVVIEQEVAEYHSAVDEVLCSVPEETDYSNRDDYSNAYRDYLNKLNAAIEAAKTEAPTMANIYYQLHVHNSRKEFIHSVNVNDEEYTSPEGDPYFKGHFKSDVNEIVSSFANETGKDDWGYRSFLKVF